MQVDVPQWLPQAYVRAVQAAGSPLSKEELAQACQDILERWSSSDRHYHGVGHLIDTAAMVETLVPEMHKPELVRLAAWYHGVVFSTEARQTFTRNGGEDEEASGAYAHADLVRLGVPEESARRVEDLVRGIRSKRDTGHLGDTAKIDTIDIDLMALRDAHMATLAAEPQRYKKYIELVRKEYCHVPVGLYLLARQEIIRHLLERPSLFITPLARQWEEATRENLQAEAQRIAAKLEALSDDETDGAGTHERRAMAARIPDVDDDAGLAKPNGTSTLTVPTPPYPVSATSPITSTSIPALPSAAPARSPYKDAASKDRVSSLESCGELFHPGERVPAELGPEELKQLKRERLAAEVRKRIEDRQNEAIAAGRDSKPVQDAASQPAHSSSVEMHADAPPLTRRDSFAQGFASASSVPAVNGDGHIGPGFENSSGSSDARPNRPAAGSRAETAIIGAHTISAPTPEWVDDEDEDSQDAPGSLSGMEREPDI